MKQKKKKEQKTRGIGSLGRMNLTGGKNIPLGKVYEAERKYCN